MPGLRDIVAAAFLVLVGSACGSDDASTGSGSGTGGNCDCKNGAYSPVCGVDGMTYDATCGTSCVPVDVACSGECPCASTTSGPTTSVTASVGESADDTSATATSAGSTATGNDCDCDAGAYVPVCGVDGMTYDAACGRDCVPVDVACSGECPCPAFMCGERVEVAREYVEAHAPDYLDDLDAAIREHERVQNMASKLSRGES